MRTLEQLQKRIQHYHGIEYIYNPDIGYIVWHISTGDNIEVLFIEAHPGMGAILYHKMLERILSQGVNPYHSVFCFILGKNSRAITFYKRMEWTITYLGQSIYRDDETVLAWVTWEDLLRYFKLERSEKDGQDNT